MHFTTVSMIFSSISWSFTVTPDTDCSWESCRPKADAPAEWGGFCVGGKKTTYFPRCTENIDIMIWYQKTHAENDDKNASLYCYIRTHIAWIFFVATTNQRMVTWISRYNFHAKSQRFWRKLELHGFQSLVAAVEVPGVWDPTKNFEVSFDGKNQNKKEGAPFFHTTFSG